MDKYLNKSIEELKKILQKTKDSKSYRSLLAKIAGMSGKGSPAKRAAAIKANKVRWAKHKLKKPSKKK